MTVRKAIVVIEGNLGKEDCFIKGINSGIKKRMKPLVNIFSKMKNCEESLKRSSSLLPFYLWKAIIKISLWRYTILGSREELL